MHGWVMAGWMCLEHPGLWRRENMLVLVDDNHHQIPQTRTRTRDCLIPY